MINENTVGNKRIHTHMGDKYTEHERHLVLVSVINTKQNQCTSHSNSTVTNPLIHSHLYTQADVRSLLRAKHRKQQNEQRKQSSNTHETIDEIHKNKTEIRPKILYRRQVF